MEKPTPLYFRKIPSVNNEKREQRGLVDAVVPCHYIQRHETSSGPIPRAGGPSFHAPFFLPVLKLWVPRSCAFCKGGHDAAEYYGFVMPIGLHRNHGAHHLHFITNSCYRRLPLFGSARARDCFLSVLEETRRKYRFVVVGYVVMPEHIHLLITEPETGSPSTVMQVLKRARRMPCCRSESGEIRGSASCSAKKPGVRSGRLASTISTYGARRSGSKSSATCTAIR